MPDELKSNPSRGEASLDAEQKPDIDTDQLISDDAKLGPLADADTDKLTGPDASQSDPSDDPTQTESYKNGVNSASAKPDSPSASKLAPKVKSARAIPSLPKADDLKAASLDQSEDDQIDDDDLETEPPAMITPARLPFDPPPTQGKRFKEIRLSHDDDEVEKTAVPVPPEDQPKVSASTAKETSETSSDAEKSKDSTLDASQPAEVAARKESSGDDDAPAMPAVWLEDATDRPDTNPLHPSTRQPRRPYNWQLQRNALENDADASAQAEESSEQQAPAAEDRATDDTSKEKPESTTDENQAPAVKIDLSQLDADKTAPSVSGAKAVPGMPASAAATEHDRGTSDLTSPSTNPPGQDSEPPRSAFTFSMDEEELGNDTAVLSKENRTFQRAINKQEPAVGTSTLGEQREVILVIRGMIERLTITEKMPFTLGRFELGRKESTEVDLTPYGALDRGVSRVHAQLHLKGDHLFVTDLGSTNGTYLAGARLEPNEPKLLRKGDELLIGRLSVQVMFR